MHGLVVLVLVESRSALLFPRPVRLSWLLLSITVTCTAMGCIQSIACNKSRIKRENIVVYDLSATIDHCPTLIEENSPIVLRYKTPYFKASARIVMPPVPRNETWVVGWIQACTQMEFYNTYGDIGMWVSISFTCAQMSPLWPMCVCSACARNGLHALRFACMPRVGSVGMACSSQWVALRSICARSRLTVLVSLLHSNAHRQILFLWFWHLNRKAAIKGTKQHLMLSHSNFVHGDISSPTPPRHTHTHIHTLSGGHMWGGV